MLPVRLPICANMGMAICTASIHDQSSILSEAIIVSIAAVMAAMYFFGFFGSSW